MAITLPIGDPAATGKAACEEFKAIADANSGDFAASISWLESEVTDMSNRIRASMDNEAIAEDNVRMHKNSIAVALDNFYKTYEYIP